MVSTNSETPRTNPPKTARVRTPSVLQMEAVECGAAALAIILEHFGKIVPLSELRRACGVSRDGSKASKVLAAARRYGMVAKGFSKDIEQLRALEAPFVLFWGFNHFLVLEGFGKKKVHLNDPAVGHRSVTYEEFEEKFTGVVLLMSPGEDFKKGGSKPSMRKALHSRLSGFKSGALFAILAGFLLVIPGLVIPSFTQMFIDEVLIQNREEWLKPILLAMIVTAVVSGVLKWLQLVGLRRLRLGLAAKMSAQFFQHLLRLPVDFYSQRYSGEISGRSQLNDKVAGVLSGQLATTSIDIVMMVFYAILMAFYSWTLTLVGFAAALINFYALGSFSKWREEANMRVLQEHGRVSGFSISGLQQMETIKASGTESGFFLRWAGYYANASSARQQVGLTNEMLGLLPMTLTGLTTVMILILGGFQVIDGAMTIGGLIAFQMLMSSFLRPVQSLVGLGKTIQELRGDMVRLDDVLANAVDPELAGEHLHANDGDLDQVRLQGRLTLEGVTFGYSPLDPPLITDFSLDIQPGQRVALVGGSGSGKSTVAKLVCGLYPPWKGRVLLDGVPRSQVPSALRSNSLSLVDQDLLLFGGTVRENLTLWDDTVPDSVLVRACQDAEIYDRIAEFSAGFDNAMAEGGGNLSGGERQRLEIARALVNNPTLLVLDEATSALDTESERLIMERIRMRGCSCLLVAHRLSTIRDCDEIIVMDRGRIVERGTHDQLWAQDGAYAQLLRADEGAAISS